MKKIIIFTIILISIVVIIFVSKPKNKIPEKLKSVSLSTDYDINQSLKDIQMLDANTVNVPVVINIASLTSNKMSIDEYSKNKAIEMVKILKEKNITVILEAFPWIDNGSKYETDYNPNDKEKFFYDWKNILSVLINEVANPYDVDIVNTASNFNKLERYQDNWCEIIEFTRKNFDGLVTYKTTWWYTASWDEESKKRYEKKLNNKLFSKVDFISIASYFELSNKPINTVTELVNCIGGTTVNNRNQNIKEEIQRFSEKYNKEIFFGELGFPRLDYAATHPWDSNVSSIENNKEQARCFEAYRIVFEDEPYIKGFSIFAVGEKSKDKKFYPSNDSINIIKKWYK
ncbi:MAG: glycoside hydrolase family 113 [Paraclostridium sp.]|uniref:glycoside hydrolase family 113 n=1 Tax=Paraclostridium sp. TaxID=2023273 RepID=UPI003F3E505D